MTEGCAKLYPRCMAHHGVHRRCWIFACYSCLLCQHSIQEGHLMVLWAQICAVLLTSTAHAGLGMQGSQMT